MLKIGAVQSRRLAEAASTAAVSLYGSVVASTVVPEAAPWHCTFAHVVARSVMCCGCARRPLGGSRLTRPCILRVIGVISEEVCVLRIALHDVAQGTDVSEVLK